MSTENRIIQIQQDMAICQADYPLDWYQPELTPYAEEYLALPDRTYQTIINWMKPYIQKAQAHFGDDLLLLAHYYMGGEIVKLVETFGGQIGDSYQLALKAVENPDKKIIIESAVHFMAESISILANPDQQVYITNPKSGCTMEMLAKDFMVEPAITQLNQRFGSDTILPISYMNTSGRVKALTGAQGGAVCTSSNVKKIFEWALAQNKKILFIPDKHMGENVANWLTIKKSDIAYWPGGTDGANYILADQDTKTQAQFDKARLILFSSFCAVHTHYTTAMINYWRKKNYNIIVHPECRADVVSQADQYGSTATIWDWVSHDRAGTKHYAVATENHLVDNLKQHCQPKGITVVNLADAKLADLPTRGCGCATMSRNDPPHLVGLLDCLRQGIDMNTNQVKAGDVVNEFTGNRARLSTQAQQALILNAKRALENMINITQQ